MCSAAALEQDFPGHYLVPPSSKAPPAHSPKLPAFCGVPLLQKHRCMTKDFSSLLSSSTHHSWARLGHGLTSSLAPGQVRSRRWSREAHVCTSERPSGDSPVPGSSALKRLRTPGLLDQGPLLPTLLLHHPVPWHCTAVCQLHSTGRKHKRWGLGRFPRRPTSGHLCTRQPPPFPSKHGIHPPGGASERSNRGARNAPEREGGGQSPGTGQHCGCGESGCAPLPTLTRGRGPGEHSVHAEGSRGLAPPNHLFSVRMDGPVISTTTNSPSLWGGLRDREEGAERLEISQKSLLH